MLPPIWAYAREHTLHSQPDFFVHKYDSRTLGALVSLVDLVAGSVVEGPAVVEATTTTYLLEPGWTLTILDDHGAAWFERVAVTT